MRERNLFFEVVVLVALAMLLFQQYRQARLLSSLADSMLTIQRATILQLKPCAQEELEKGTDVRTY